MKILMLFTLILASKLALSKPLTSPNQIQSFNCTLTHTMGITQLKYESNNKSLVHGVRNRWIPVQYSLHSAGINYETQKSHISLSGGRLSRSQYLTLSASSSVTSSTQSINGSIILNTIGGSVFAPQLISSLPIGQFYCSSIVIK